MEKNSHRKLLFLAFVVLSTSSYTAAHGQPAKKFAAVETIEIRAEDVVPQQVCSAAVRFRGRITAATAGRVRYRLRSEHGVYTTPWYNLFVSAKEAREIQHLRRVGRAGDKTIHGTLVFEVATRTGVRTAKASFAISCMQGVPETQETAGLSSTKLQGVIVESRKEDEQEDLLEEFRTQYLDRRGYSLKKPFDDKLRTAYERLREMRQVLAKPHRPARASRSFRVRGRCLAATLTGSVRPVRKTDGGAPSVSEFYTTADLQTVPTPLGMLFCGSPCCSSQLLFEGQELQSHHRRFFLAVRCVLRIGSQVSDS